MTAITSLKDLIQKISNDDSRKFSKLAIMLDGWLSLLSDSTKLSNINRYYGYIYGCIMSLYLGEYITEIENETLNFELSDLYDRLFENVITHIMECTEEGD